MAPLLELGAGFDMELTGRENVFLNGAILRRSRKEMQRRLPDIVAFAELEHFIDAPLRTYSTGMVARLGFAVATDVEPEILLVDEVLSVGDIEFQEKCMRRMEEFLARRSDAWSWSRTRRRPCSSCASAPSGSTRVASWRMVPRPTSCRRSWTMPPTCTRTRQPADGSALRRCGSGSSSPRGPRDSFVPS